MEVRQMNNILSLQRISGEQAIVAASGYSTVSWKCYTEGTGYSAFSWKC
jgi:hypothetical protein